MIQKVTLLTARRAGLRLCLVVVRNWVRAQRNDCREKKSILEGEYFRGDEDDGVRSEKWHHSLSDRLKN